MFWWVISLSPKVTEFSSFGFVTSKKTCYSESFKNYTDWKSLSRNVFCPWFIACPKKEQILNIQARILGQAPNFTFFPSLSFPLFIWDHSCEHTNVLSFFPSGKNPPWHSCLFQKLPGMGHDMSWSWQAMDGLAASQIMMLRLTLGVLFSLFTLQGSVCCSMRSLHFWAGGKSREDHGRAQAICHPWAIYHPWKNRGSQNMFSSGLQKIPTFSAIARPLDSAERCTPKYSIISWAQEKARSIIQRAFTEHSFN